MSLLDFFMIAVITLYFWDIQSDGKLDLPYIDFRRILEALVRILRR